MNHFIKQHLVWLWLSVLSSVALTSCDMMTEDREDCPTGLYLTFKYDYNLQRADMFSDHVGAVDVYVFDENGKFVISGSDINGQQVRLRGSDGINFTKAGKRKLAFYVEKEIRRVLGT